MSREIEKWFDAPIGQNLNYNLPLDEFKQGNFSQGGKIFEVYDQTIKRIIKSFLIDVLGENFFVQEMGESFQNKEIDMNTIYRYTQKEKNKIAKKVKEMKEKEKQKNIYLQDRTQKVEELKAIFTQKPNSSFVKILAGETIDKQKYPSLGGNKKNNPEELINFLEEYFLYNNDQYIQIQEIYENFKEHETFKELQAIQTEINTLKNEITTIRKSERGTLFESNIEDYYKKLKNGTIETQKTERIREKIEEFFGKKINREIFYDGDLKTTFLQKIAEKLILYKDTNKELKYELIKRYELKPELFSYIFDDIYHGRWIMPSIYNYSVERNSDYSEHPDEDERNTKIEERYSSLKEELKRIIPEYSIIKDEELLFLKEELKKDNKKQKLPSYTGEETEKKIKEIFGKIYGYLDDRTMENNYEELWNIDVMGIPKEKEGIKHILQEIYFAMTPKEQKDTKERYKGHTGKERFFKEIEEKEQRKKKQTEEKKGKQLTLRTDREIDTTRQRLANIRKKIGEKAVVIIRPEGISKEQGITDLDQNYPFLFTTLALTKGTKQKFKNRIQRGQIFGHTNKGSTSKPEYYGYSTDNIKRELENGKIPVLSMNEEEYSITQEKEFPFESILIQEGEKALQILTNRLNQEEKDFLEKLKDEAKIQQGQAEHGFMA